MSLLKKSVSGAKIELSTVHAHVLFAGENASVCFCYGAARKRIQVFICNIEDDRKASTLLYTAVQGRSI